MSYSFYREESHTVVSGLNYTEESYQHLVCGTNSYFLPILPDYANDFSKRHQCASGKPAQLKILIVVYLLANSYTFLLFFSHVGLNL